MHEQSEVINSAFLYLSKMSGIDFERLAICASVHQYTRVMASHVNQHYSIAFYRKLIDHFASGYYCVA